MTKDLTKGNVWKTLLLFAIPMVLGNLFQQFYNIADTIIVGRTIGAEAIGAVGVSFPIVFMQIAVSVGIGIGSSVIISQLFGAKKLKEVKKASYTSLICTVIGGLIFTLIGEIIARPILVFLKTPEPIMLAALDYLRVIFYGSLAVFVYNVSTAIFNALGNSKAPLVFLTISTIMNIFLDIYCIVNLRMGVKGAAVATVISQVFSALLAIIYLMIKLRGIDDEKIEKYFDFKLFKSISKIALPSMLQQSFVGFGMMALQGAANLFGTNVVAGYTAACKIDAIVILPILNLSNALATFAAQNIGAKKIERVKEGFKVSMIASVIFCISIAIVIYNFGDVFINMFLNDNAAANAEVVAFGTKYLQKLFIYYILMAVFFNTCSILRGAGEMKSFLASSIVNMAVRIAFANIMVKHIGQSAIWYAIVAGWVVGGTISVFKYLQGTWMEIKVIEEDKETNLVEVEEGI